MLSSSQLSPKQPGESFWEHILSREPGQIRAAYSSLDDTEQTAVISHLQRMIGEEGWHPEQIESARIALQVIQSE